MPRKGKVKFHPEFAKVHYEDRTQPPVEKLDLHFFGSSYSDWKADENVENIFKFFNGEGRNGPWHLFLVPLPFTSSYDIDNLKPKVAGVIAIGSYYTDSSSLPHFGTDKSAFGFLNLSKEDQVEELERWKNNQPWQHLA